MTWFELPRSAPLAAPIRRRGAAQQGIQAGGRQEGRLEIELGVDLDAEDAFWIDLRRYCLYSGILEEIGCILGTPR